MLTKEEIKMKAEMNINEMEQVNGGNFIEDAVNFIKKKDQEVNELIDVKPKPVIAYTK